VVVSFGRFIVYLFQKKRTENMNNLPPKEFNTIVAGGTLLAANAGFINAVSMAGVFPGIKGSRI
jgi:hypothetical protein